MAVGGDSTTVFKADISNFKAAMQEAARYVRLANSEFKEASAGLGKWSDSAEGLQAKCTQLNKVLDAQKRQLDILENAYREVAKEEGEDSKGAQELAIKLNNQKAAIKNTQAELDRYEKELNEASDDVKGLGKNIDSTNDQVEKASDGFTVMKGVLANLVAQGIRLAVTAFKDLATEVYNTGANFESAMSKVSAISGANAEDMQKLTDKAKQMGETTVFSATQSAEAFNYMAMAGWKTEDMLNGIEGIMNLAAASGEDLATTSDIVTDALTAMGYEAKDAGKLADVMAAASSNANTNVSLMGQTFQYAAPIVGALGYNMEDTAVAIGLMANAGIKGQKAGTALRSVLTRLSAPPKECADAMSALGISLTDSEGNMKSFKTVMNDLRKAFSNLSSTQQTQYAKSIAGQEAMSGLLAIVNAGTSDFDKLTAAVEGSTGAASAMAKTMTNNVSGQLTLLKSNIEGKMIKVFEKAAPTIKKAIGSIGDSLDSMDWDGIANGVGEFSKGLAGLVSFILTNGGTILNLLKNIALVMGSLFVISKIGALVGTITTLVSAYGSLNAMLLLVRKSQLLLNAAQLASPVGAVIALVAAATAGFIAYENAQNAAVKAEYGLSDAEKELQEQIQSTYDTQKQLTEAREKNIESITGEYNYIDSLKDEYNSLIDTNGKVKEGYEDRANFIINQLADALGIEKDKVLELIDTNGKLGKSIDDLIRKKQAEATLSAYEESYKKAKAEEAQALKDLVEIQNAVTESEKKYNEVKEQYLPVAEEYNRIVAAGGTPLGELGEKYEYLSKAMSESQKSYFENKKALETATKSYEDAQKTIKNYEGLSSAIISGDVTKINEELTKLTQGFKDAKSATQQELEEQVQAYEKYYQDILKAEKAGNPVITKQMVNDAKNMLDKAKAELDKFPSVAGKAAESTGLRYASSLEDTDDDVANAAHRIAEAGANALYNPSLFSSAGMTDGGAYASGVQSKTGAAYNSGANLAGSAKGGAESVSSYGSGQNFGWGYASGIQAMAAMAANAGAYIGSVALNALKKAQLEGSPSKLTRKSGRFFGLGYANGITNEEGTVEGAAVSLGETAVNALRDAQKEHSPSKLTFASGVNFVKGYINGIASMSKNLVNSVKNLVGVAISELSKASNYNYTDIAQNATKAVTSTIDAQLDYLFAKVQYQNEQKLKDFDDTITQLEKERENALAQTEDKARQTAIRSQYESLINTQKQYKNAYQTASKTMISDLQKSLKDYEAAALNLINNVVNNITDKYDARYNALLDKQDTLVSKMKQAGSLFDISGAGVLTVNDLTEQTRQINEYARKLTQIKSKVSEDLFNEIADLDLQEGSAFIDRLLQMSESDLNAYNEAYQAKLEAASKAGSRIYGTDFDKVASDYRKELGTAFDGIPAQLEELGTQAMKGFVNGLTKDTDYMEENVRTFVNAMLNEFVSLLQIHSPSRVTEALGEFTGKGFGNGLLNVINFIKDIAQQIAAAATSPLEGFNANISGLRAAVNPQTQNAAVGGGNVVNNYNLVQNNTSPKALTALETYQARRQQIALIKALAP